MKPERLAQWMRKHSSKVEVYRLHYAGVEGGDEQLGEWDAVEVPQRNALAETIVESAQQHCDEMAQSCRYRVAGYDSKDKSILATTMRQQPEGGALPMGAGSVEDASATGVTGQAIRHNEALMQMFLRSFGQMLQVQHGQVEQLQKSIAQYQRRESDMLDLARTISTMGEDGVLKERSADRWDKLVSVLTDKVGPAVLKEVGLLPDTFGKEGEAAAAAAASNGIATVAQVAEAVTTSKQ